LLFLSSIISCNSDFRRSLLFPSSRRKCYLIVVAICTRPPFRCRAIANRNWARGWGQSRCLRCNPVLFSRGNFLLLFPPPFISFAISFYRPRSSISPWLSTFLFPQEIDHLKNSIFWDITPYSLVKINLCFRGGTYRLHLQGRRIIQTRNRHVARSKQTQKVQAILLWNVGFHRITQRYIFITTSVRTS
jgi:hypothetical protein